MPLPAVMSPPWSMKPLITCILYMFSNLQLGAQLVLSGHQGSHLAHVLVMYPMEAAALEVQRLPRLLSCSSFSGA